MGTQRFLVRVTLGGAAWLIATAALAHLGVGPHVHPHPGSGIKCPGLRLLEHVRQITVNTDGSYHSRIRLLYLLETKEAAAAFSTVSYSYNPVLAPKLDIEARLLRRQADGSTVEVKSAVTKEHRQPSPRVVVPTIELKIAGALPGDVVEIVVDKTSRPLMPGQFFVAVPLAYDVPTQRFSVEIDAPARQLLTAKAWGASLESNVVTKGDRTIHTWSLPQGIGPWAPRPGKWVRPVLMVSTPATWEDVRKWLAGVLLPRLSSSEEIKALAQRLAGEYDDYMQRLDAIAQYVGREIANKRFEVGREAYVPRKPEDVLKARTGDCKDKAVLMASLLRAAGLVPHLAVTCLNYTLPPISQIPPNPYVFDHVVVGVSGPGNTIWLDPTGRAMLVHSRGHKLYALFLDRSPARFFPIPRFRPIYDTVVPKL